MGRGRAMRWALPVLGLLALCCVGPAQAGPWRNDTAAPAGDGHPFRPVLLQRPPLECVDVSTCLLGGGLCHGDPLETEQVPEGGLWWLLGPRQAHKPLFPLSARDIIGLILAALGLALSASGGLGGGGILVPLYLIVLRAWGRRGVGGPGFAGTLAHHMSCMRVMMPIGAGCCRARNASCWSCELASLSWIIVCFTIVLLGSA